MNKMIYNIYFSGLLRKLAMTMPTPRHCEERSNPDYSMNNSFLILNFLTVLRSYGLTVFSGLLAGFFPKL